jgi:hypothetical protein
MAAETFQKIFNTGVVTLIPSGTNPSPIQIATLKDVSLDISCSIKELRGSQMFPEDIALTDGKVSGKAKSGRISGAVLQATMPGMTSVTGQKAGVYDERAAVPGTPYAITVTNSATWSEDMGVVDINTGLSLTRVDSSATPTTGQYKVTAGVYTFAAADTLHVMSFRYSYTLTTGLTFSLSNSIMGGTISKYAVHLYNNYDGVCSGFKLYACVFPKLSIAYKAGDYGEVDLDFSAFADSTGKIIDFFKA